MPNYVRIFKQRRNLLWCCFY